MSEQGDLAPDAEQAPDSRGARDTLPLVVEESLDAEIELVFGVTRAVGTPSQAATEQLRNSLSNYGYEVLTVKVSDILKDRLVDAEAWSTPRDEGERVERLIEAGNQRCEVAGSKSALAHEAMLEIRRLRRRAYSGVDGVADEKHDASEQRDRTEVVYGPQEFQARRLAFIVDSLKRPGEVTALRQVYGDHFILVGLQARKDQREARLVTKMITSGRQRDLAVQAASDLITKDDHEDEPVEEGRKGYGQDMLGTFPMSDVFIDVNDDGAAKAGVERVIQLLFGDPSASGPTDAEHGMQLATQTATTSTELGRRVGAAIVSPDGELLALGSNHHPLERDAPAFDAGALDVRQLAEATLDAVKHVFTDEARRDFEDDPSGYVKKLFSGKLKDSDLKSITEYQRAVHAEMNALVSVMRQRLDPTGSTLYVTSYPCHNCAKHLLALRMDVSYLEPYAKGKAAAMYGDAATSTFVPFTGVAPRRFDAWFLEAKNEDRKDSSGMRIEWSDRAKHEAMPWVSQHLSQQTKQLREKYVTRSDT